MSGFTYLQRRGSRLANLDTTQLLVLHNLHGDALHVDVVGPLENLSCLDLNIATRR